MASCNSQRIRGIDQEQVGCRDVSAPCKRLMITAEFLEPRSLPFPAAGPVLSPSRAPAYNRARHVLIDHWSCDRLLLLVIPSNTQLAGCTLA